MCKSRCHCLSPQCNHVDGECTFDNAPILFDRRTSETTNTENGTQYRIRADHWVPVHGNDVTRSINCTSDTCVSPKNATEEVEDFREEVTTLVPEVESTAESKGETDTADAEFIIGVKKKRLPVAILTDSMLISVPKSGKAVVKTDTEIEPTEKDAIILTEGQKTDNEPEFIALETGNEEDDDNDESADVELIDPKQHLFVKTDKSGALVEASEVDGKKEAKQKVVHVIAEPSGNATKIVSFLLGEELWTIFSDFFFAGNPSTRK